MTIAALAGPSALIAAAATVIGAVLLGASTGFLTWVGFAALAANRAA